jgi:hypothetical protein
MRNDSIWPTEVGGGSNAASWLNRLLRACKRATITDVTVVGGTAKIQNGCLIISTATNATGFNWQTPYKELDTTRPVSRDTFVYITPGNTLVTAGMTDIVTNLNVISCEGIWQAAQNVPAAVGGKYNVPIFPYPSATGLTSGSPGSLKGDLDGAGIFFYYWGQISC